MKPHCCIKRIRLILWLLLLYSPVSNAQSTHIDSIHISGNKKTRDRLILQELAVQQGDSINEQNLKTLLSESTDKLMLSGLFNFVDIRYENTSHANVNIWVDVIERWYLWIYPIFEIGDLNFDTYFLNREYHRLNYGVSMEHHNFLGINALLKAKLRIGYREQYSLYMSMASLNCFHNTGLWAGIDFFRMKETVAGTLDYRPIYVNSDNYLFHHLNVQAGISQRLNYNWVMKGKVGYHYYNHNIDFSDHPEKEFGYPEIAVKLEYDTRNNRFFATRGSHALLDLSKHGLGIQFGNISTLNHSIADASFNTYLQLGKQWFAAIETRALYQHNNTGDIHFWLYKSIGYDNYLRGCDNLIINSAAWIYSKNTMRLMVLNKQRKNLNITGLQQFDLIYASVYLSAFADLAYAKQHGFIAGCGAGIDISTYYDRVLSIYYAYNNLSEKFNIFVQFRTPIIKQY